jgi:hypothetical protein
MRTSSRQTRRPFPLPAIAVAGLFLLATSTTFAGIPASAKGKINFNRDIRPILSDRCFACHGPDGNKRESGLRLDLEKGLFEPLPKHSDKRAIVPGKVEESFAYQRMIATDPNDIMPPVTVPHLKLNQREKDLVKQWIEEGASWSEHWSFVTPKRPELPVVTNQAWPRNDIDRFVLARLEDEGLSPSPEAQKTALIRRLSLDLIGLPPTPEEVDAFVADTSESAYEKLVDRLLTNPHYGEQMAVSWLDSARYADSHGYQSDPERFMSHWRDWVIDAYNANMPFDQFAIEQLAGDLLPNPTESQKIATGFNRNHRMNSEGGIIDEEWRVEGVIDRVETTGTTFLGLTLGCARCHDHKYDPITQKEFFQFSAYFNSINERGEFFSVGLDRGMNAPPLMKVFGPETKKRMDALKGTIAKSDEAIKALHAKLPELEAAFKADGKKVVEPKDVLARWTLDDVVEGAGPDGATIKAAFEGGDKPTFVEGKLGKAFKTDGAKASIDADQALEFERTDAFSYGAWVKLAGPDGAILSKMDAGPTFKGFDLFLGGGKLAAHIVNNFSAGNAIKVSTKNVIPMNVWSHVFVTYDGSSKAAGVRIYLDGRPQEVTADVDKLTDSIKAAAPLVIGRRVNFTSPMNGLVDDVRFYKRTLTPSEVAALATGPDVDTILPIAAEKRTDDQKATIAKLLLGSLPEYVAAESEKAKAQSELAVIENDPRNTTMVMEELPKPRDTFVLTRGQYDLHAEKVEPATPAIFPPLPADAPKNRLALARWIVDPANPLTARVQANRLWEKFFGMGLVKTTENFGVQTEWPSHPELLDWLATEFVALKWDQKALQKMIVMSATYRQAANVTPELLERDPENRLLARGPRFRLSAEQVRDQALAVSGLLVPKVGGPSVKPYQPDDLWAGNLFGNLVKYVADSGDSLYRRSMYTFVKRTALPANLMTFDMASREYCTVKRSRTNTPLQALDKMNDPTYVEAARVLAERMIREGGDDAAARIGYGFKRATCRPATPKEIEILTAALNEQLERYRKTPEAATKLVSIGARPRDPKLDAPELAAYTMAASVIMNLDEMINKP